MGLDTITTQKEAPEKSPLEQAVADELNRISDYRSRIEQRLNEGLSDADQTVRDFADMNFFYGELAGISRLNGANGALEISEDLIKKIDDEFRAFETIKDRFREPIRKLKEGEL